jgi:hypothetical protein
MDLGLENPVLHRVLSVENEEGVSDAFLYGASVQKIARPALEGAIFFAPAGTASGDPEKVLTHPRWGDLVGGFSEADATLLPYLPTSIPGAERILGEATDIVFLARKDEDPVEHLGTAAGKVVAALGPLDTSLEPFPAPSRVGTEILDGGTPEPDPLDQEVQPEVEASGLPEGPPSAESDPFDFPPIESHGAPEQSGHEIVEGASGALDDSPSSGGLLEGLVWEGSEFDGSDDAPLGGDEDPELAGEFSSAFQAGQGVEDDGLAFVPDLDGDAGSGADSFVADPGPGNGVGESAPVPPRVEDPGIAEGWGTTADDPPRTEAPDPPPQEAPVRSPARRRARISPTRLPSTKKSPPRLRLGLPALALMAVVAVAGTATGYLTFPDLSFLSRLFNGLPEPELALEGPEAIDQPLGFSLLLFSYQEGELAFAREMQVVLESRLPNLMFSLVPGGGGEEARYLLLAGPAHSRAQAEALRTPLSEILDREDPYGWSVRETPRAFFLGERQSLGAARALLVTFEGEGIDPYILEVSYSDGSKGYRVLAGAFAGVDDARALQTVLRTFGVEDPPLIERRGILPE